MKLAIAQIVFGALVVIIDSLAIGGSFSIHFSYPQPNGGMIDVLRPEAILVTQWATIAIIPLGLLVIATGIIQLRKTKRD